ncbi:ATP-binding cassette domain-containing protein [Actinacidiphila sp. ITFR-21]|uniref:ATP-binding cassette domain-containing protein n=1 Tax=Actinacidiphila sp. ITFR-21 TaxID=3075199 RepID=UPI00288B0D85|nr:ATP-binding cassette domain-containing protein [Streptomyces sp. ITFR-21]WNI18408.1 ATP-binding cassette domain-containing protein [Streptomyces sp. ITFR-21]
MIQAIGLTSTCRRNARPAVADLTFDVHPGAVTGLLGPAGSGKSTAVRLLLGIEAGRGSTLVDGCLLHDLPHPAREIGALVGDIGGHPRRTARGHLRMLCAAFGVPLSRADETLHLAGLDAMADERLGTFSLGMDRRLGTAVALLARPRLLVLDDPARGLPPREAAWVHGLARGHAEAGGAVLLTGRDARSLARTADRVIALDKGRLVADEPAADFARSRLRPHVEVRSPYAERLAGLLGDSGAEVVMTTGTCITAYGTTSAEVGETAYRHGVLLHHLSDGAGQAAHAAAADEAGPRSFHGRRRPPPVRRIAHRTGPERPVGYEVRRAFGVRTPWITAVVALSGSALGTVLMTRLGPVSTSPLRLVSGWAAELPLPAAAIGAGGLGALSYGQEFTYPALAPGYGPEPRSPRLLVAKLAVAAVAAVLLAGLAAVIDVALLYTLPGARRDVGPLAHPAALAGWAALAVGCAWAGVLAAAVFRTTALGLAAVLAVPVLVVPAVRAALGERAAGELGDAAGALWSVLTGVSQDGRTVSGTLRLAAQPFFLALVLSLVALAGAYAASAMRGRRRGRRTTAVPAATTAPLTSKKS